MKTAHELVYWLLDVGMDLTADDCAKLTATIEARDAEHAGEVGRLRKAIRDSVVNLERMRDDWTAGARRRHSIDPAAVATLLLERFARALAAPAAEGERTDGT